MTSIINFHIPELEGMKHYPQKLYFKGNSKLLKKRKVSIVGTRHPTQYTKQLSHELSQRLSNLGICIVSGAAMGVDAIAHKAAQSNKTIAVVANGLNIHYPKVNKKLIEAIEKEGLMISQFEDNYKARPYSFVQRNEVVVALGEILIITQADLNSGSLRSAQFAIKQNKPIYVLSHRIGESLGTQALVKEGHAKVIYDLDEFLKPFGNILKTQGSDDFINFCKNYPSYEDALEKNSEKLFEYELLGKIKIENGRVSLI